MTDLLDRVVPAFEAARDPVRAEGQAAYMRDQFRYLGLTMPQVRTLAKRLLKGTPRPPADLAPRCWAMPEREYQYFAVELLRAHPPEPEQLDVLRELITTKSWWDTVDPLATRVVGDLVRRHRELDVVMDEWSGDENMWLVRTAILHQLHWGAATEEERLFGYCTRQAGHRDFFVRKAIGWALRHYARTAPEAVRGYVDAHSDILSGLSIREATKHL